MTTTPEINKLAEKLAKALATAENEEPYIFNRTEVEVLKSLIAFVDKLKALRWFGQMLLYFIIAAGTIIINWERISEWWKG